jgi:hypothetical protein
LEASAECGEDTPLLRIRTDLFELDPADAPLSFTVNRLLGLELEGS